jgi:type IV secretion system protein VirB1
LERYRRLLIAIVPLLTLEIASAADLGMLMQQCAPSVHPATLSRIIRTESGGQLFALADAGPAHLPWSVRKGMVRSYFPASKPDATEIVNSLLKAGHLVSIGLTQVNNRNLSRLGLSVGDVLDPCTNLRAGAQILTEFYQAALPRYAGDSQKALVAAISAYNTGDFVAGIANGYVRQVLGTGAAPVPALRAGAARAVAPPVSGKLLEAKFATLEVETF